MLSNRFFKLNCIYLIQLFAALFLGINFISRILTAYQYNTYNKLLPYLLVAGVLLNYKCKGFSKWYLFIFGFSFFLFGFRPYDIESQTFEFIVTITAIIFLTGNLFSSTSNYTNKHLSIFIFCYVVLSASSFFQFPFHYIFKNLIVFGPGSSFFQIYNATSDSYLYSLSGINRLVLFALTIFQISVNTDAKKLYQYVFAGIFVSVVFSAVIGILDYYELISLKFYRYNTTLTPGALHSTFLNRGWFSEFVITASSFVLLGFITERRKSKVWYALLFSSLIITEIALIFCGARAGWLSYPLILIMCWYFYYYNIKKQSVLRFKSKDYLKIVISAPITIIISLILVFYILTPIKDYVLQNHTGQKLNNNQLEFSKEQDQEEGNGSNATHDFLISRSKEIINPKSRVIWWLQGYSVAKEKPLTGLGYDAYNVHASILFKVKESHLSKSNQKKPLETPHNIYLQLMVSGGITGLSIWLIIIVYSLIILFADSIQNKEYLSIAVLISILSFHIIGVFQSMQYVPMIWFLMFLNLGYVLTINDTILKNTVTAKWNIVSYGFIIIVCICICSYIVFPFSKTIAKKYHLDSYPLDKDQTDFLGFFGEEKWADGIHRWSGRRGYIRLKQTGPIEVTFTCAHPDITKEPVNISVSFAGKQIDEITFQNHVPIKKRYFIPDDSIDNQLEIKLSRVWNPFMHKISDDKRWLGVSINKIHYL